jgi:hypothetical protein
VIDSASFSAREVVSRVALDNSRDGLQELLARMAQKTAQ